MLVTLLLLTSVLFLIRRWWSHPCKKFPLGVRGFPIVGALPYLGKYPERVIGRWSCDKYGPIMSVRFGMKDIVVINDYDLLRKAFIYNSSKYMNRPLVPLVIEVNGGKGFTFRPGDDEWRIQRNFLANKLNRSSTESNDGKATMKIHSGIQNLISFMKSKNEQPFHIDVYLSTAICAIICNFCFGRLYDCADPKFQKLTSEVMTLYSHPKYAMKVRMVMLFPGLKYFPFIREAKRWNQDRYRSILDFVGTEIKCNQGIFNEHENTDYAGAFLREQKRRGGSDGFDAHQLQISIVDCLIAGTEPLTTILLWGFLCLLHFPSVQGKLYAEICSATGLENKIVTEEYCDSLPYTMAFLQELYRFRTVVPLGLQRMTTENIEVNGYNIPKCTPVIANVWAIHNDPSLWKDPHLFQPERHLDEDGSFIFSNKIIPFLIGGRSCPGEKFARTEAFLLIANLIRSFEFLPDPDDDVLPDINEGFNGLVFNPNRFKIVAKNR